MRQDVHFAALAAASRVAFSVTLLAACGGAAAEVAEPEPAGEGYASSESELAAKGTRGIARKPKAPAAPCHDDAGTPKKSCGEVLATAFGDAGWFDPDVPVTEEVKTCCTESGATTDYKHPQHWACCGALEWSGTACTPWGPPVPPAMKRKSSTLGMA